MPANKGIDNAQLVQLNQDDSAIADHTQGETFNFPTTVTPPLTVPDGHEMWFGSGNAPTNYNTTTNGTLESGLKVHLRGGADVLPTSSGPNSEQVYNVPGGLQPGSTTRADWNFDYVATTAANNDLSGTPQLSAEDFRMQISVSSPSFVGQHTAVFDLNPDTHVWTDAATGDAFGGDDFNQPGASPALMARVAENSVNVAFGSIDHALDLTPAQAVAAGTTYDIKEVAFAAGSPHMNLFTHDVINVVAPTA